MFLPSSCSVLGLLGLLIITVAILTLHATLTVRVGLIIKTQNTCWVQNWLGCYSHVMFMQANRLKCRATEKQ